MEAGVAGQGAAALVSRLTAQLDFLLVLEGLGALLVALGAIAIAPYSRNAPAYRMLALAGILGTFPAWLNALHLSFPDHVWLLWLPLIFLAAAGFVLLSIVRLMLPETLPGRRWVYLVLAGPALLFPFGLPAAEFGVRLFLIFLPTILAGAWFLLRARRRPELNPGWDRAVGLLLLVGSLAFLVPESLLLAPPAVLEGSPVLILLITGAVIARALVFALLWGAAWSRLLRREAENRSAIGMSRRELKWIPALLLMTILGGWGLTEFEGARGRASEEEAFLRGARVAAAAIRSESLPYPPGHEPLDPSAEAEGTELMHRVQRAHNVPWAGLFVVRDGRAEVLICTDCDPEDSSITGPRWGGVQFEEWAETLLPARFKDPEVTAFAAGAYRDQDEYRIAVFAPIPPPPGVDGPPVYGIAAELPAGQWTLLGFERRLPFLMLLNMFCLAGMGLVLAFLRSRRQALRRIEAEGRFRAIADNAPILILSANAQGECDYVNPFRQRLTGRSVKEERGHSWREALHPEDRGIVTSQLEAALSHPHGFQSEFRLRRANGSYAWIVAETAPIESPEGDLQGFVSTGVDITERRKAEEELAQMHTELRALFSAMPDLVLLENEAGDVLEAHWPTGAEPNFPDWLLDPARRALLPRGAMPQQQMLEDARRAALATGELQRAEFSQTMAGPDGKPRERRHFEARVTACGGGRVLTLLRDITGQKEARRELEASNKVLLGVAEMVTLLLTESDQEKALPRALQMLGTLSDADRVYLYEVMPRASTTSRRYRLRSEWTRHKEQPGPGMLGLSRAEIREAQFAHWARTLEKGVPIEGRTEDFPDEVRTLLRAQRVEELVVVPIHVEERWWGLMGLDFGRMSSSQREDRHLLVQFVTKALGAALGREFSRAREQDALEQLQQANQRLQYSISRVQQLAEQATAASRAKSEFLANVSHEVRTPLNAVLGMTELLFGTRLSGEQREYAEGILASAQNLLGIINDILDFSKVETGRFELARERLDLRELLDDTNELLALQAEQKGLEYYALLDPAAPAEIVGDGLRLRQVLTNLISNAIKFTSHGRVLVEAGSGGPMEEHEETLVIRVEDTGVGVPEEKLNKLFEPFSQVDASSTRTFGGTGLGLSIVKRLVDLMHGTITVESREGKGSLFTVTIPVEMAEGAGAVAAKPLAGQSFLARSGDPLRRREIRYLLESLGANVRECSEQREVRTAVAATPLPGQQPFRAVFCHPGPGTEECADHDCGQGDLPLLVLVPAGLRQKWEDARVRRRLEVTSIPVRRRAVLTALDRLLSPASKAGPQTVTAAETAEQGMSALVVEDNRFNRIVLKRMLERHGIRAMEAEDGAQALAILRGGAHAFSLVFVNMQMDGMDGLQLLREIRGLNPAKHSPGVPVIAVTAHAIPGDQEKCVQAGMDDYIAKPISAADLERVLKRWGRSAGEKSTGNGEVG